MIVWTGRGFVAILIWVALMIISLELFPREYLHYTAASATFITAACCWFLGNKWNNQNGRTLKDEETGEIFEFKPNHSFFWIKLQYWGYIFSALGLIYLAKNSINAAIIAAFVLIALISIKIIRKKLEKKSNNIRQ